EGTAMQSFAQLLDQDKWGLAYRASSFAYPEALAQEGKRLSDSDPALRSKIPDLNALSSLSEAQLAEQIGRDKAGPVIAYLRSSPVAVIAKVSSLAITRERLEQSLAAYRAGNHEAAKRLALSAYLDGFEPVEPMLSARSPTLLAKVEQSMGALRAGIGAGADQAEIAARVAEIQALVNEADSALAPDQASNASA